MQRPFGKTEFSECKGLERRTQRPNQIAEGQHGTGRGWEVGGQEPEPSGLWRLC